MALIARTIGGDQKSVLCDTDGRLVVSAGGILFPVKLEPTTSILTQGSITTIAGSAQTTIVSYAVSGSDMMLDGFVATGTVDAEYALFFDAAAQLYYRSSEEMRTAQFMPSLAIRVAAGVTIYVKVTHFKTYTADFDATIIGHRF